MKKLLLLLITLVAGLVAHATLQTGIILQGVTRTVNNVTMCSFAIQSNWGGDQIPSQTGSSYTFSNATMIHGTANVTLNGTLNFQTGTSFADVITSGTFTVTIESSSLWFYGATVQTRSGTDVSGCSASVSSNNHTLTVTIPSGKTFGSIIVDYVSNPPISSSNTVISGLENSYLYLGDPIEPEPVVTYNGAVLTKDTDYTLSYWGSNRVGEAQLTVTGTGEYAGDISKRYTIRKVALTDFNSLGNNTYEIATTTDLDYLALYISGNDYGSGITFKQTADIAYSYTSAWNATNNHENNFTAIGRWGHSFRGTYDGQNYTISGIRIYKNDTTNYDTSQGLFGYISSGAIVKNVILADARITGYNNTGGIVGYNSGAIEDCRVESNVIVRTAKKCSAVGGIAGISDGANTTGVAIRRCTFKGRVIHGVSNSTNSGGIVGELRYSTVSNCLALGAYVRGYDYSGAIVGNRYKTSSGTLTGTLTANYYHDCTVKNTNNSDGAYINVGVGIGSGSEDQDGARSVHALTLPDGVTATGESVDIEGLTHYAAGTTVTLACSNVPEGYMAKYSVDGNSITGETFTMPAADATVTVQIIAIDYSITLPSDLEHATVTSDKATAHIGDTVTLTFTPEDESYIVSSLTVMNGNSEVEVTAGENNTYTFVMPAANVTVNVEIQRLRYIFNSETGVLKLIYGAFNKDNKWGNDVRKAEVTSVTATNEVRFTGDCSELFSLFSNCTSMDLSNVNTDSVTIMVYMFYNCPALTSLDLSGWNTANVTDMSNMFNLCNSLSTLEGISDWNTAAVTDMSSMFSVCSALTSLDLSNWNTAAVNYMNGMFRGCSALTSLTLSGWNTAAVTYMDYMFSGCSALTTIEGISSWNTAEVIDMSGMFYYCSSLTSLDLSGWDTGKVAAIHVDGDNGMFQKCTGLTSLNLTGWNMGNITDMSQMFYDCSSLTTIEGISQWDVSNVTDMHSMFYGCSSLGSLDLSGWNTSEVTKMNAMFNGCSNLATIYAGKEWNTENVTISGVMFKNCTNLVGGMGTTFDPDHTNAEYARYDHGYDEPGYLTGVFTLILPEDVTTTTAATLTHNGVNYYKAGSDITLSYNGTPPENMRFYHFTVGGEPIDGDIFAMPFADAEIGVEYQARYTFDSTTGELALIWGEFNKNNMWGSDVNKNYVTSITATDEVSFTGDCTELFWDFTNCTSMDLSNVNTDSLTNGMMMFENCQNLESLNLSGWNTASVTNMQNMFSSCPRLNSLDITGWNTANVTNMINTFGGCSSLKTLDLSGWNTASVTNMNGMFACCDSLKTIDFSGWNTASVTNMSLMFYQCFSLETLDLTGWNTASVTNMHSMFEFCSSLQSLNLIGWNTASVTNMSNMFHNCESLTTIEGISGWDVSNVTDMSRMFAGCQSVGSLDLSGWNTSEVTDMDNMFGGCSNLATIYAGKEWNTENVTSSDLMFENCTSLVGGMSTTFDPNHTDGEYARIDHGADEPGYLTGVFALTLPEYVTTTAVATLTHNGVNLYAAGDTITLNYGGEVPEGYAPVYSVNGNAIEGDTFVMPFEDATVTVEVQRLRYIYDSETHELALLFGPFNKNDKWGDDVPAEAVTSVTATDEVRFTGDCSQLFYSFNNCTSMDLSNVNTSEATNMASMFLNCVSLESLDVSNWNTGKVTDMGGMFSLCGNLYSLDISSWNTANVTDLSAMFASCRSLDSLDISSWDVSNVTNMTSMFYSCSSLTTLDLSTWNTGNVTDMGSMFGNCTGLTTLDLKGWDVSNVTSTATMFNGCSSLTALDVSDWTIGSANLTSMFLGCTGLTTLDLSTWDTSNVTDMNGMFINCASLTTIYVGEGWTTENVTSTGVLFLGCTSLVGGMGTTYDADHIGLDYARMDRGGDEPGYLTGVFALTLPEDVTASPAATLVHDNVNLYAAGSEITLSYGGEVPEGYGPVYSVNGNTIGGNTFEMPFGAATVTVEVQRARYIYNSETGELALNWGEFNKNDKWGDDVPIDSVTSVTATDEVSFTGDCSQLFRGFRNCTSMDLSNVNTSEATNMASMFLNCVSLESLDVSNWNTGKVTDMSSMFVGCIRLESLDILNWNTASVANMSSMFTACSSLTALDISNWDTGSVTNMSSMFTGCTSLTTLNITGWNTASVNSMSNMFIACPNLESLDLSGWNTASVTNISAMFNGCTNLTTIYVGEGWTTENVTGSGGMFGGCTSLVGGMGTTYDADHTDAAYAHIDGGPENPGYLTEKLPRYTYNPETGELALIWGEFNKDDKWGDDVPIDSVKSVTATDQVSFTGDCSQLFYNFTNCTSMDLSKVNTDSVTKMSVMFAGCRSLDSLDISSWNTANVTNMGIMFNGCSSLKTLDLSSWDVSNVTNIGNMFQFCQSLESLNLSGWNTSSVTNMSNMFQNCTNLTTLDLSGWDISNIANVGVIFYGCTSLTTLDVSGWTIGNANLTTLFLGCTGITTLDLSTWNTAGVTNMSSMFAGSANLTTIYVGEGWTTENVTSSGGMFGGCTSLVGGMGTTYDADHTDAEYAHIDGGPENPGYFTEKLPRYTYNPETGELALIWGEFNKDDKWGDDVPIDSVKSVTATDEVSFTGDCSQLFRGFRNCTSMDLSKVNTDSVTSMYVMFAGCTSLNSLDISSWNTSNVTNMGVMFQVCQSLETLDISSWDVSNVTEMGVMFDGCTSLKTLDLSGWNISNVTNMSNMFVGCTSLETVNLSGWSIGTAQLNYMFLGCTNLTTVDLSGWTIENATGLCNMFTNCSSLTTLDVSDWNIVQANMSSIFCACGLTTLDLSTWNTAGVTNMNYMFAGSANLATIYVGEGWTTENVTSSGGMFSDCTNLVGGMGTTYDANHTDGEYAHIDGGTENPGYFTAAMTSITLAEMLENGVDGENYIISDDLAVVDRNEATGQYFVSDGNGNWIAINAGDFYNNELASLKGGFVKGTLGGMNLNPYFTLSAAPVEGEDVEPVEPTQYSLANEFAPKVNEVIIVKRAYYKASENALRAYAPGNTIQGQSLTVDTSFGDFDLVDGQAYDVQGVINIKEPWSAKAGLMDYDYPFQNYTIKATSVEEIDPLTDINSLGIYYGSGVVNVYNAKGQLIKRNVKASEATEGLPSGVYVIGNKKVYVK